MAFQTVFKRYELKYMLTLEQKEMILNAMEPYMLPDKYGRSTIRNIYFDDDSYRLIRRSIERPVYKEKLRVRSYDLAKSDSTVFVELKKKYQMVVYKRRLALPEGDAMKWIGRQEVPLESTQISREIDYFIDFYGNLTPKVFLSYEREAFFDREGSDFRITFDENILARTDDLTLCSPPYGKQILDSGKVLMELKCAGAIPLWMVAILSREKIYKTSFSKYGTAYSTLIFPELYLNNSVEKKEIISNGQDF